VNAIFFAIVLIAFGVTGYREVMWTGPADTTAPMQALGTAMIDSATSSVTLAIGLIGVMALFLGLMKVAEAGGLLVIIAKTIRPLMVRLFPDVPPEHPAMGAMVLNLSANALGLGNAATPFGIRAMQELDTLNPHKGTASNAMVLFLAINTSSVTLLPTGVIAFAPPPVPPIRRRSSRPRCSPPSARPPWQSSPPRPISDFRKSRWICRPTSTKRRAKVSSPTIPWRRPARRRWTRKAKAKARMRPGCRCWRSAVSWR
jgi:spore maturation protein SpmA